MPFRDVVGHHRLVQLLSRSAAGATLPPSLLFAGPSGVGKCLTAVALAQTLNCTNQSRAAPPGSLLGENVLPLDACGRCAACRRIARGVHPDVIIVEPGETGSIKIVQVRDVIDRSMYRPFEGRCRVVIIDEADAMDTPPQHALLKTLEEPPSSSVFVLVTSRPDLLLPTVRSRCPELRFRPLSAEDIASVLVARKHTEAEARAVAAAAGGSVGHALQASAGELVEARDVARRVLEAAVSARDVGSRLESAKELLPKTTGGERDQLATHLRAMASLLRDVEVLATEADTAALANPDVRPALEKLAKGFGGERGVRAFGAIDQALVALDRNAGVKVVADWLVLQL
jgi:DNA polymerase III subunit delta'